MCLKLFFFFFQAEDGIRDVERSRGLGDVYKRQYQRRVHGISKPRMRKNFSCAKPYKCSIDNCDAKFKSKDKLQRHLTVHTNERQYTCPKCKKNFKRKDHLSRHLFTHDPETKKFICPMPYCTTGRFVDQNHLDRHIQNVHKIMPKCMVCALEFSKKSDLKKHEKEVHMRESDTIPKMPFPKLPAFPRIQEAKEQFEPHPFPTLPPPPQEHGVGGILPCIAFIPYQGQLQPIFIPFQMPQKVLQSSRIFHNNQQYTCLLYTSPSPRDLSTSRMPSSA
eukprot:TRINITY_DN22849_c0_g1_i5.p1 TRINITY_DN22849_c0_g1~~TRINITY_DN22849_c0_g1_i5.p1  ORF type:complete len:277 (-),score=42.09 TRINITY_DN22849_c0_g1_i5:114-944(-)